MKKVISIVLALAMILCFAACGKKEEPAPVEPKPGCYVTIVLGDGSFAVAREFVEFVDYDGDGAYNIDEALRAAHAAFGKEEDYGSAVGEYGLGLTKLWGDESYAWGYYINNASAWSLADPVVEGDYVVAWIYQDQVAWSDAYTYFESTNTENGAVTFHVCKVGFDENWAPVAQEAEGAEIFINGTSVGTTDAEGKLTYKLNGETEMEVVAKGEGLVPAICRVKY